MKYLIIPILLIIVLSCREQADIEKIKEEITATEQAFNDMAAEKGITEAFVYYADDSAVLMRGKSLITGKHTIEQIYRKQDFENTKLSWKPDFVGVAGSGDLAYTYGKYQMIKILETGDTISDEGIFHTIWKRQKDGSWKYVWD